MPIPAIIGGALAAGSIISNMYDSDQRAKRTREAYKDITNSINATSKANEQDIADYEALLRSTYGQGANSYQDALAKFLSSPVYQNKDFAYVDENGNPITIDQFFDPAANQQVAAAMDAINASSSTGHNRFSSDYVNAVAAKQRALSSEAWRDAYDRMMRDRSQALSEYNMNSQNGWNNYNATTAKEQAAVNAYGADRTALMQGLSDTTMAGMNNRLGTLQSQVNATTGLTNAQNQESNPFSQILGPASQFMGSYFGASK